MTNGNKWQRSEWATKSLWLIEVACLSKVPFTLSHAGQVNQIWYVAHFWNLRNNSVRGTWRSPYILWSNTYDKWEQATWRWLGRYRFWPDKPRNTLDGMVINVCLSFRCPSNDKKLQNDFAITLHYNIRMIGNHSFGLAVLALYRLCRIRVASPENPSCATLRPASSFAKSSFCGTVQASRCQMRP